MNIKEKIQLGKITHEMRASQAVLQYGVGAMVDFPEQTLMTAAPETWENCVEPIHDERLENYLDVDYFGMPGRNDDSKYQAGISYTRFPEWYFCPKCRRFKPINEWVEEYREKNKNYLNDPYMVKKLKCSMCFQDLVVTRIVVACGHGHIDDFPWSKWVHAKNFGGPKEECKKPKLRFITSSSSSEGLEGLTVICSACGSRTTLRGAFDKGALEELDNKTGFKYGFRCIGRHPWKNAKEKCDAYPHVLQRGGSSVYFPISFSSLVIPPYSSMLTNKIQSSNAYSELLKTMATAKKTLKDALGDKCTNEMIQGIIKQNIEDYSKKISYEIGKKEDSIKDILNRKWDAKVDDDLIDNKIKYRVEEYDALSGKISMSDDSGDFVREEMNIDEYEIPYVKKIVLVHKIREVQALVGFSRIEPVDSDSIANAGKISAVKIKNDDTRWYPGYEVRGEGIFIEFDNEFIDLWRTQNKEIIERTRIINENYKKSYYGSMKERNITSKYIFLHTMSHLIMKELSFECGYNIASIKERIYCSDDSQGYLMSGILIYTACGDAEGTMGGLVRQGRSDVFSSIFKRAIKSAMICSNDPVCSLSQGQGRDSLNMSACYACMLVPETACEDYNVFLDRATIIGTYKDPFIGMYSSYIHNNEIMNISEKMKKQYLKNNILCVIKDYGVDLGETSYSDIWDNMLQFAETGDEKNLFSKLSDNHNMFIGKEKPYSNVSVDYGNYRNLTVDLLWKKSNIMLFSSDNFEEYNILKESGWKCIYSGDNSIKWSDIVDMIM